MLKLLLSEVAHGYARDRVLEAVDRLSAEEVRLRIHQAAPVLGRVYTLLASEEGQRGKLRETVQELTDAELRRLMAPHVPPLVGRVLFWLDEG